MNGSQFLSIRRLPLLAVFAIVFCGSREWCEADVLEGFGSGREKGGRPLGSPPPGWTVAHGGDGGKVLTVTTLEPEGPGSLGAALAAEGARRIEFKVAGVIDLNFRSYRIKNPDVTIAGETAPSPGITLTRGGIGVQTNNVVIRHIRVRPGSEGRAAKSGWEVDGLATGEDAFDVIVQNCSFSWATDENLSVSGPRFEGGTPAEWRRNTSHRITFSQNIVAEGLRSSSHSKGAHSMGTLVHDNTSNILIHGNLYISNNGRNPLFKGGARGAVINNFIHNPGGAAFSYGLVPEEWGERPWERGMVSVIGNVVRRGRDTGAKASFALITGPGPCDAYFADNMVQDEDGTAQATTIRFKENWDKETIEADSLKVLNLLKEPPFSPPAVHPMPAAAVEEWVLKNAGARPWDRDGVDVRLIEEARTGKGKIIDSETEVGGRAALAGAAR
jgi:hypothetical protein